MSDYPEGLVESLANVYATIQACPDGPEVGRATAIAMFKREDAERGTNWAPSLEKLMDRVDAKLRSA